MPQLLTEKIEALSREIEEADRILIGAGAGLSAAAGLSYFDEEAFKKYYPDMHARGFHFPYELVGRGDDEWTVGRKWAYWATHINYVRNIFPPAPLYKELLSLVEGKDWFVVTSNADRQFMRNGFDMDRVFEYQGHYDTLSCSKRCTPATWNNYEALQHVLAHIDHETFECPEEHLPRCPHCGALAEMGFRPDNWNVGRDRYVNFVNESEDLRLCIIELGVGFNTPAVIRWPFERICYAIPRSTLFRVNRGYLDYANHKGYPQIPAELGNRAVSIDCDAAEVIRTLVDMRR